MIEAGMIPQPHQPIAFTRAKISEAVAGAIDVPRWYAEAIVDAIFDGIAGALNRGDKVELRGFGTFTSRQRGARVGRNPKTGVRIDVAPKRVPHFKPSRELLQIVNR
jgi:integration host factor subunit beta